jgi:hypothetical protein
MNDDLKELHKSKDYDEIYNLIETKFSQFESRWNRVLASEEGIELYRNTKLSDNNRDKIYRKMFAELIIRECSLTASMFSINKNDIHPDVKWVNMTESAKMVNHTTCQQVAKRLKQHFGVE